MRSKIDQQVIRKQSFQYFDRYILQQVQQGGRQETLQINLGVFSDQKMLIRLFSLTISHDSFPHQLRFFSRDLSGLYQLLQCDKNYTTLSDEGVIVFEGIIGESRRQYRLKLQQIEITRDKRSFFELQHFKYQYSRMMIIRQQELLTSQSQYQQNVDGELAQIRRQIETSISQSTLKLKNTANTKFRTLLIIIIIIGIWGYKQMNQTQILLQKAQKRVKEIQKQIEELKGHWQQIKRASAGAGAQAQSKNISEYVARSLTNFQNKLKTMIEDLQKMSQQMKKRVTVKQVDNILNEAITFLQNKINETSLAFDARMKAEIKNSLIDATSKQNQDSQKQDAKPTNQSNLLKLTLSRVSNKVDRLAKLTYFDLNSFDADTFTLQDKSVRYNGADGIWSQIFVNKIIPKDRIAIYSLTILKSVNNGLVLGVTDRKRASFRSSLSNANSFALNARNRVLWASGVAQNNQYEINNQIQNGSTLQIEVDLRIGQIIWRIDNVFITRFQSNNLIGQIEYVPFIEMAYNGDIIRLNADIET